MLTPRPGNAKVLRIDQSPMNPLQWCCLLACGHDQWVTAKRKPERKHMKCDRCVAGLIFGGAMERRDA